MPSSSCFSTVYTGAVFVIEGHRKVLRLGFDAWIWTRRCRTLFHRFTTLLSGGHCLKSRDILADQARLKPR